MREYMHHAHEYAFFKKLQHCGVCVCVCVREGDRGRGKERGRGRERGRERGSGGGRDRERERVCVCTYIHVNVCETYTDCRHVECVENVGSKTQVPALFQIRTATHCNTLQHAATYANTLQHTATQHVGCKTHVCAMLQGLQIYSDIEIVQMQMQSFFNCKSLHLPFFCSFSVLYVCMRVCVYVCMFVCFCLYVNARERERERVSERLCLHAIFLSTSRLGCACVCERASVCLCVCDSVCAHVCAKKRVCVFELMFVKTIQDWGRTCEERSPQ